MTDWLERAQHEIQLSPGLGTAKTAKTGVSAVTAVHHLEESGIFDRLWWRVGITEPGGRTVEVDAPSGASLADWQAFAARYHSAGCVVTPLAGLPKTQAPVPLDEVLAAACDDIAGITLAQFRALLSPEDITDIEGGRSGRIARAAPRV